MINRTLRLAPLVLAALSAGTAASVLAQTGQGYEELVTLFDDFRDVRASAAGSVARDAPDSPNGVTDYSASAVAARIACYNVPFIERPEGLNFWEKVQFRDPHPDHLHAVIPGHRYDGWFARRNTHPIRSRISDGVRVEGWGVYMEEPMVRAGVIDHLPRVHELMYLFGIFRATRVTADIGMQLNEMTIAQGAEHMKSGSPWLDDDVARVDAEIYLRRPPGYGLGYTIGNLQIQQLLGEVRARDGEGFDLKAFNDAFLARGRMPVSLIRYEMLGVENQVDAFWEFEPIPPAG